MTWADCMEDIHVLNHRGEINKNRSGNPGSNQGPGDMLLANYSHPLFHLSYCRSCAQPGRFVNYIEAWYTGRDDGRRCASLVVVFCRPTHSVLIRVGLWSFSALSGSVGLTFQTRAARSSRQASLLYCVVLLQKATCTRANCRCRRSDFGLISWSQES